MGDEALRMLIKQLQFDLNELRERFSKIEDAQEATGHPRKGRRGK